MEMPTRSEAERRIRERAVSDSEFREQLNEDPRSAIEAEFGIPVPSDVTIHVHQESMTELHLVIPTAQDELSDADLELVAGGGCYGDCPDDPAPP